VFEISLLGRASGDSETVQSPRSKVQGLKASGKGEIIAIKRFEDIEA